MRAIVPLSLAVLALASLAVSAQAPDAPTAPTAAPQVAQTPPMGWNSWNYFAGKVDDKGIRAAADQIVATGMKDAGYTYVNIDDTWEGERDANGVLHTNAKFPDMKALADYVHSKGLKIGIYSSPGPKTCAGYEASLGHEAQDAKLYAEWGIDYLKYDLCSFNEQVMQKQAPNDHAAQMHLMIDAYSRMNKALKATGRPILFSLCQYGWDSVWSGALRSALTCGGPQATSVLTGTACTSSSASRKAWKNTRAPATGTTPTCSKSATASYRSLRTARTFPCGRCWPPLCSRATTCPT
jgi:alpha-galactosidase